MKPQNLHAHEDRLLDFVYGELPAHEAQAVESHLQGCTRCTELLDGIRGVRTTMAQLPVEPAPDAGLESLLAYAQQAARNASAGPAPKPTWWRRWLVPAMGLTAVSVFGVVTLQVNKSVDLSVEQAVTASRANKDEAKALSAESPPAPAMVAENTPPAESMPAALAPEPQAEPLAKLESNAFEKAKVAPRKKATLKPSPYDDTDSDWSNAGAGTRRAAQEEGAPEAESPAANAYAYDRRDARTQGGAFSKSKPMLVGKTAPSAPAPTAAPVQAAPPPPPAAAQPGSAPADDGAGSAMDEDAMAAAPKEQQGTPLRLGDARRGTAGAAAGPAADKAAEDDAFDALFGSSSEAKREQRTRAPATASVSKPTAGAPPKGRAESPQRSPAELSKLATAARSSGDRVREALYLRQALEAGATGKERLGLLNRLCDAEFSIGRRQAAIEACNLVLEEDPRSSAAQVARSRLKQEAPARAEPDSRFSAPKSSAPVKADELESSAPAQAQ
ncbi:MAG TPA: zf-HC2 domain-containing protein [Myxococcaceae bacterium]|jgi:hypothetical protein